MSENVTIILVLLPERSFKLKIQHISMIWSITKSQLNDFACIKKIWSVLCPLYWKTAQINSACSSAYEKIVP